MAQPTCNPKVVESLDEVLTKFEPEFKDVKMGGRRRHSRRRSHRRGGGVIGDITSALCKLAYAPIDAAVTSLSTVVSGIKPKLDAVLADEDKKAKFISVVNKILATGVGGLVLRDLTTPDSKVTYVTLALLDGIRSVLPDAFTPSEVATLGTNLASIGVTAGITGGALLMAAGTAWGLHMLYTRALVPAAKGVAVVASEAVTPEGFGRLVDGLVSRPEVSRAIKDVLETPGRLALEDMPVRRGRTMVPVGDPLFTGVSRNPGGYPYRRSPSASRGLRTAPVSRGGRRTRKKHTFRRKH